MMDANSDDDGRGEVGQQQHYDGKSGDDLWSELLSNHMVWVVNGNMDRPRFLWEEARARSYTFSPVEFVPAAASR